MNTEPLGGTRMTDDAAMSITPPPVGARVRHVTTYPDGTLSIIEGIVMPYEDGFPHVGPYVNIGKEQDRCLFLIDQPTFTVALEVLEQPSPPPEPTDGYYLDRDEDVWQRVDDEDSEGHWRYGTLRRHWATLNQDHGPLKRLILDPADSAPALPWTLGHQLDRIGVTDNNLVWVNLRPDYHTPEEAELRAAAILRAAREARQP